MVVCEEGGRDPSLPGQLPAASSHTIELGTGSSPSFKLEKPGTSSIRVGQGGCETESTPLQVLSFELGNSNLALSVSIYIIAKALTDLLIDSTDL